ncbi:hypothetical protein ACI65C_012446 [Semiaphis heraclei]
MTPYVAYMGSRPLTILRVWRYWDSVISASESIHLTCHYAPSIMALVNGIGCLSGMATPYIAGILTPNRTVLERRLVFWIMMIVKAASSVLYGLFGSGELQPWDNLEEHNLKEKEKAKSGLDDKLRIIHSNAIE